MSLFPGAHATVYRNEAGEPLGWDTPSDYDPLDDYDPFSDHWAVDDDLEDDLEDDDEDLDLGDFDETDYTGLTSGDDVGLVDTSRFDGSWPHPPRWDG